MEESESSVSTQSSVSEWLASVDDESQSSTKEEAPKGESTSTTYTTYTRTQMQPVCSSIDCGPTSGRRVTRRMVASRMRLLADGTGGLGVSYGGLGGAGMGARMGGMRMGGALRAIDRISGALGELGAEKKTDSGTEKRGGDGSGEKRGGDGSGERKCDASGSGSGGPMQTSTRMGRKSSAPRSPTLLNAVETEWAPSASASASASASESDDSPSKNASLELKRLLQSRPSPSKVHAFSMR